MGKTRRRILASVLVVVGVAVMLLAPDSPSGLVLLGLGIVIEVIGLTLEGRSAGPD